jgi:multiple sugar transport system substrate-binding protein
MSRPSERSLFVALLVIVGLLVFTTPAHAQGVDWQAYKGTSLRVMANKGTIGEALGNLLPEFETLTGIKLQFELFTEDQFREKLLLELAAGTGGLDAFMTNTAQEGLKFYRSGWYEPLESYLKNPKLTDPAFDLADISNRALQGNMYDGKLVALPLSQAVTMLYYRKDLFARNNLATPQTFQDVEEAAKKLHNVEADGQKVVGITLRGKGAAATSQWAPFMLSMGGSWLTKDGKPAVNSPEAIKAFDLYGRLLRLYGPPGSVSYHWYEANSLFAQGKAAMMIDTSTRMFFFENPTKAKVVGKTGYALFPEGSAGRVPTMEVWSIGIAPKSKKKEAAYLFTQWAGNKQTAVGILRQGVPVPRASAWKAAFMAEKPKDWLDASVKSLDLASTLWNPPIVAVSEVRDEVGKVIVSSILGENVKAAADRAAAEMAKIMEKTEGK